MTGTFQRLRSIAVVTAGLALATPAMAGQTLTYSEYGPERAILGTTLNKFAQDLRDATDGDLTVRITYGGALIALRDVLRGLGDGVADMGTVVAVSTPVELFNFRVGDLPMGSSDPWVGMKVMQELAATNPTIRREFADQNLRLIANFTTTAVVLICTEPLKTLADLKGRKVRSNPPHSFAFEHFGAISTSVAFTDVYQSLDRGLIDCAQTYIPSIIPYRHFEVAKHVTLLDFGQNLGLATAINERRFQRLTADQQAKLLDAADRLSVNTARLNIDTIASARAQLENSYGVTFHTLSPEDHARLLDAGKITVDAFLEKGDPAVLDQFMALQAKYRAELETEGYPWTRK
ncbi:C4-dicarboxylate TRAP transporter substrate-binding protein (plasmid) [Tistrella mobilis]|uniref:C4-dicarboxylate TRAP transporter substrate-binding protein n=1 Tax=Tistrella mobilis TaxID=171437 RepID=UPI003557ED58